MDIIIRDLSKEYDNGEKTIKVLDHLNLEVRSGEFVAILGPSGCGKTTLLKIMGGFDGEDNPSKKKPSKEVFMIFQDFNQLFPWRTLGGNINYAIRKTSKGITKEASKKKALEVLKEVGLEDYYQFYPHQLSGGMKQRGALARALAVESKVLLMDEPFSSLDSESKNGAHQLLLKLWKEKGITVIFVTHDLEEARKLSGKIIHFEDINGKIPV